MKLSGLRIRLFVALLAAGTVAAQQKSIRPSEPNSPGQVPIATPQGADGKVANPPKQDEPLPGGYYRVGGEVSAPRAIKSRDPEYTNAARNAKIKGSVVLWLVVNEQGLPEHIKVQKSLGYGLDESAINAVKHWKFKPATKDGKPVAVMINIEVNFDLY
jgi:TonB family protein